MIHTRFIILIFCLTSLTAAAETDIDLAGVSERHVMIPMRDGAKLSAYLYFPPGDGPWPVLYEQRYSDLRGKPTRQALARLAWHGYVVAAENFRGTHLSEGSWVGYRALGWGQLQDGYDTVEWLASQPWSTGKIGTFGGSQAGFAQNFLAIAEPPHLTCQYMIDTGLSLFHEGYRIGGATKPQRFKTMANVCRNPDDNRRLLEEWFAHPTYDDYWAEEDCSRQFAKMDVPCFTVGSWYDYMCVGSVQSFSGRQHQGGPHSRGAQQLLIGPWRHGGSKDTNRVGELVYPENARFAMEQHMLRWFDHYLKGVDNGVEREPVVRYYVMGAVGDSDAEGGAATGGAGQGNEWRTADDWPIAVQPTSYYLRAGGALSDQPGPDDGRQTATVFRSDPDQPAGIPGPAFPGAADARSFEAQAEVRSFTSDALSAPVEWTGLVQAELFLSSSAPDTDVIVRLSDVYPDGRSILILDMIRRVRYREGFDREVLMTSGKVYRVAFDVGWLSQVFARGHRIRVTVAGTGAPFYEPQPNTSDAATIETPDRRIVAENGLRHGRPFASRIIAPLAAPKPEANE